MALTDADIHEATALLDRYVSAMVHKARYEHSVRTAQTAETLCRRYGLPCERGYFAGLTHDMCKDMNEEVIFLLAVQDNLPVSDLEAQKKSLLHGRAAATVLKKDFGIDDADILEAVRFHTFGCARMGDLAKILYIADKIEPGRPHSSPSYVAECMKKDLNTLLLSVAEDNARYLKTQGKTLAPETADLIQSLKKEL